MVFHINALMCVKKVRLIIHDWLPILMLLDIMLYICCLLAYLMLLYLLLFVCIVLLFLSLIYANAFYFHVLSWFIDTWFAYFMHSSASCTVLLICWFFLILCSHRCCFFNERAMCSPER